MAASYSKIIEAKDGNLIPVCKNEAEQEISLHSKYNPLREAETFSSQVDSSCSFFIVLGLAGGYHIQKLLEKCPKAKIFAVEKSQADIDFLGQITCVKNLMQEKRVLISDISSIEKNLLSFYKPAVHGNLIILPLRSWENVFPGEASLSHEKITKAIKLLSADFSVQSHFGKIWQKNILTNLSIAEKTKTFEEIKKKVDTKKIAAIIAAGPSLDESMEELKKNRETFYIVATDTAFSVLLRHGIESDAVVSIDGQNISHEHYLENLPKSTTYIFDLCATPSAVRKALKYTENVVLAETGHPLSQYASFFSGRQNFIHLEAGSGTVTIAAASFAQSLGFPNDRIKFFGADFSYINGRPYARGTYLESKFHSKSTRFSTAEKSYSALMYRTPVIKICEGRITTEILEAYRSSLEDFMSKNEGKAGKQTGRFIYEDFKLRYCNDLRASFRSRDEINEDSFAFTTLLPLCAQMGKDSAFLAYLKTLEYTEAI